MMLHSKQKLSGPVNTSKFKSKSKTRFKFKIKYYYTAYKLK